MIDQHVLAAIPLDDDAVTAGHHLELAPVPRSVSQARHFVRSHAPQLSDETQDSLTLLTSELVSNAVIHARTAIEVDLLVTGSWVVVAVHDLNLVTPLQQPYADREGGWGLGLVGALAESWCAVVHPEGGKTTWFRLPRGEAHAVADGAAARADADGRDR